MIDYRDLRIGNQSKRHSTSTLASQHAPRPLRNFGLNYNTSEKKKKDKRNEQKIYQKGSTVTCAVLGAMSYYYELPTFL